MRSLVVLYLRQWSTADDDPAAVRRRMTAPAHSPVVATFAGLVAAALEPAPAAIAAPARHRRSPHSDPDTATA